MDFDKCIEVCLISHIETLLGCASHGLWHRYRPSNTFTSHFQDLHHELRSKFMRLQRLLVLTTGLLRQLNNTVVKNQKHIVVIVYLPKTLEQVQIWIQSSVFAKAPNAMQTTLWTCEPTLGATGTAAKPRKFRQRKAGFAKQKTLLEQQYVKYMVCDKTIGVIYTIGFQYITQIWVLCIM